MPPLHQVSGKKLLKMLQVLGFSVVRSKGSHFFLHRQLDGKTAVIPIHGNEEVGAGLLRSILRDIELSVEEYEQLRLKK